MNYEAVIPWPVVRKHLQTQLAMVDGQLRSATGDALIRLQGRAQLLEELLHLPEILVMLEERDGDKNGN